MPTNYLTNEEHRAGKRSFAGSDSCTVAGVRRQAFLEERSARPRDRVERGADQPWVAPTAVHGVSIAFTAERIRKLALQCDELLQMRGTVPRPAIRQLAGLASWMSTLMSQLSAFTAMLWAAVGSTRAVALRASRVRKPLLWFRALCGVSFTPLEMHCRRLTPYYTLITFDGSLTGGGATLQAGVADWEAASTVPVISFWADTWTDATLPSFK